MTKGTCSRASRCETSSATATTSGPRVRAAGRSRSVREPVRVSPPGRAVATPAPVARRPGDSCRGRTGASSPRQSAHAARPAPRARESHRPAPDRGGSSRTLRTSWWRPEGRVDRQRAPGHRDRLGPVASVLGAAGGPVRAQGRERGGGDRRERGRDDARREMEGAVDAHEVADDVGLGPLALGELLHPLGRQRGADGRLTPSRHRSTAPSIARSASVIRFHRGSRPRPATPTTKDGAT